MTGMRLHILSLIVIAFAATAPVPAQVNPGTVVDVWPPGKMPGKGAAEAETALPSRGDNATRITNVSNPTLTIFPAAKKRSPAVIVSPGGGYSYVVIDKEGTEVAAWLNSIGVTALVLKYRNPNNREGALQDVQRAISLTRANATKWNIDAKRIGVMGFSAGGHASARASTQFARRSYDAIDTADKLSSRPDFAMLIYPAYLEKDGRLAPEFELTAKVPPTLIVTTEDDKSFYPGCVVYHAALDAARIKNKYLAYKAGGHGYALRSDKEVRVWPDAAKAWLREIGVL